MTSEQCPNRVSIAAHAWLLGAMLAFVDPLAAHAADLPPPGSPPGGNMTTPLTEEVAFGQPPVGLSGDENRHFFFGSRLFHSEWEPAPGSIETLDGLGPLFKSASCAGCHERDGRGRPPAGLHVRLSVPAGEGTAPHPAYGSQLQDRAVDGVPPEATISIDWEELPGAYADGRQYSLRRPVVTFADPNYGPFGDELMISSRVAPAVFGLGLLEAVPAADILANADPHDEDGDGISGRPNRVPDIATGTERLGRFGWKANVATLHEQNAGAANGDMGLTSTLFPDQPCTPRQTACRAQPTGGTPELSDEFLASLTFYTQTLAVPSRREPDAPEVIRGGELFVASGCAACHTPTLKTAETADPAILAGQTFHPYTDLLLHDMGDGLADNRPDHAATGREWRTAPLWGLGLVPAVNGHTLYLHDGRARGIAEAILWHGGEAERAKEAFRNLPEDDRAALIAFVNSL